MFPSDGSDPAENYRTIRKELEAFSDTLGKKQEIVGANKIDLAIDDEAIEKLRASMPGVEIMPISGASHQGVMPLMERAWRMLNPPIE